MSVDTNRHGYSILHCITRLDGGGSAENTMLTAIGQVEKGNRVTVLYGGECAENTNIRRGRSMGIRFLRYRHLVRAISPIRDCTVFIQLFLHFCKNRYVIVHTHTSKAGIICRWAAYCARIPYIVHTPHGHVFYGYFSSLLTAVFVVLERLTMHCTDAQIALTQQEKADYLARGIGGYGSIHVIYSGISLASFSNPGIDRSDVRTRFNCDSSHFVCVTVARLAEIKNHGVIVDAAVRLKRYGDRIRFLFVGGGELYAAIRDRIIASEIPHMVTLTGWRNDIPAVLHAADCFILCSKNEGMGRVFIEAQAAGLPVIGSRVCGIPEVVQEGKTGFLIDPEDDEGLARLIERLYHDTELRCALSAQCRSWITDRFGVERMVADIETVYTQLRRRKPV